MKAQQDGSGTLPEIVRAALVDREKIVAVWRPSFWRFAQQFVLVGAVTSLFLGFTGLALTPLQWVGVLVGSIFFWGFVFDDWKTWLARRGDLWVLSELRLIYFNPDESATPASLRLDQISGLSRWPFLTLRVKMTNGEKVLMRFLAKPTEVRGRILAERATYLRETH